MAKRYYGLFYRKKKNKYVKRYDKRRKAERYKDYAIKISAFLLLFIIALSIINFMSKSKTKLIINNQNVAAFNIPYSVFSSLKEISEKYSLDFPELLTYYSLANNFFPGEPEIVSKDEIERGFIINYESIKKEYPKEQVKPYIDMVSIILSEIKNFPIPGEYSADNEDGYMYGNSWGAARSYGGERDHQGTDILDRENIRGRIPIISMTDGTVENIGWNEKGGYRVGIRTAKGTYYYYAHLAKFEEGLQKGSLVSAGDTLGYMGDTGYSKKEGTTGNFVVHLHLGISADFFKEEFWINPYIFLRNIEDLTKEEE
jgi:murein DD-endopeptidase MepM/ murein hydrolase activator NlpD